MTIVANFKANIAHDGPYVSFLKLGAQFEYPCMPEDGGKGATEEEPEVSFMKLGAHFDDLRCHPPSDNDD